MQEMVVFVGPSLGIAEAERIAPFEYRPPAAQGDVLRAVRAGARAIGLIDGYFEGVPAVWHKEILNGLSQGVHVFGAASMGALRAAELHIYGMRGVGRIFDWYASGQIDADDEVALVHAPAEMGYRPLSLPLVNVRATLEMAAIGAPLDAGTAADLLSAARRIHFKQRNWRKVVELAGLSGAAAKDALAWLAANTVDQKRLDAGAMIEAMAALAADWSGPFRPDFVFEPTHAWDAGLDAFDANPALSERDRMVLDEARIGLSDFAAILAAATAALSVSGDANDAPGRASRRIDRFRAERGLHDAAAFRAWLADNGLDEPQLAGLLARRDAIASAADGRHGQLAARLVDELKLRGHYADLSRAAAGKQQKLAAAGSPTPAPGAQHMLLEWFYRRRLKQTVPDNLEEARMRLALPDVAALRQLISREYLIARLDGCD